MYIGEVLCRLVLVEALFERGSSHLNMSKINVRYFKSCACHVLVQLLVDFKRLKLLIKQALVEHIKNVSALF